MRVRSILLVILSRADGEGPHRRTTYRQGKVRNPRTNRVELAQAYLRNFLGCERSLAV